jgi:predicted transposase/invertase (TIGR01784 family)
MRAGGGIDDHRTAARTEGHSARRTTRIEIGKLEVARTMLENGLDRNTVMKMTGLSEDDLAQIRH